MNPLSDIFDNADGTFDNADGTANQSFIDGSFTANRGDNNNYGGTIINNFGLQVPSRVPESFKELIQDTHWWKSPPEIDLDHLRDKHNLPEAGTGEWIFKRSKYRKWKERKKSRLLWLCGGPGTGKTMLAKGVAAEFLKELDDPPNGVKLVSCFITPELLTDMTSADEADLSRFWFAKVARDLLYSILCQDRNLFSGCKAELKMQGDKFFTNPSSLWKVLKKTVHACQADHVYILIDGIDSLKESLCKELIKRILGLADTSKVKIFISSRSVLYVSNNLPRPLKIDLDANDSVKRDVKTFIKRRVNALEEWDNDLKGRVRKALRVKAEGIFLYASLAIENLACLSSGRDFETFLRKIPTRFEDIYRKMLRSLTKQEGSQKVLEVIESVALALRPLTFGELGHILAYMEEKAKTERQSSHGGTSTEIQIRTEKEVKKYVQSSLGFLRATATTVSIVHNTAREYLFDERREDGLPRFSKTESDLSVSWECFQYLHRAFGNPEKFPRDTKMNLNKFRDPSSGQDYRDGEPSETPWEVARGDPLGAVAKWPYLRYAAESWFIHARRSIEISGDKFYDNSTRNWLQYQFFETSDDIRKPWVGLCGEPKMEALVGDQAPVHIAVSLGLIPLVNEALPDLTMATNSNRSLLYLAAKFMSSACGILIDKGGPSLLTAPDQDGNTPLHEAVIFGRWPMLTALVRKFTTPGCEEYRNEINRQNSSGNTPLHLAVQFDHPDMILLLVEKGADKNIENDAKMTASQLGAEMGRVGCLGSLRQGEEGVGGVVGELAGERVGKRARKRAGKREGKRVRKHGGKRAGKHAEEPAEETEEPLGSQGEPGRSLWRSLCRRLWRRLRGRQ